MYKTTWYFEISSEARMGIDHETGVYKQVYMKFEIEHLEPMTPETYEEMKRIIGPALAETSKIPAHCFIPITEEEYRKEEKNEARYPR